MWNRFFNLCSVLVRFLKKNSDSVRNEVGSVQFKKTCSVRLFTTRVTANITATVDDMTLTSLMSLTTTTASNNVIAF